MPVAGSLPESKPTSEAFGLDLPSSEDSSTLVGAKRPRLAVKDAAAALLIVAAAILILAPFVPYFGLDCPLGTEVGWTYILNFVHCTSAQFGKDVVWTYGPLGFMHDQLFLPQTFKAMLTGWIIFSAALGLLLARVGAAFIRPVWLRIAWAFAALMAVAYNPDTCAYGFIALSLAHYFCVVETTAFDQLLVCLGGAMVGALALDKFSIASAALIPLAAVSLHQSFVRKSFPTYICSAVISFLLLWCGPLHQHLLGLPEWIAGSFDLASGYAEAMTFERPDNTILLACIGLTVFTCWRAGELLWRNSKISSVLYAGSQAFLCAVMLKASFVRDDAVHSRIACLALLFCSILLLPISVTGKQSQRRLLTNAVMMMTALSSAVLFHSLLSRQPLSTFVIERTEFALRNLTRGIPPKVAKYEKQLKVLSIWTEAVIPQQAKTETSIDIYPWQGQMTLDLPGVRYLPRPILGSYSTYTVSSQVMNAAHLADPNSGPKSILFQPLSIDNRYPSVDDGLSWPYMLANFHPVENKSGFLLLRRNASPKALAFRPTLSEIVSVGTSIPIATTDNRPVFAQIEVNQTLWGKLCQTIYKIQPMCLTVTQSDGRVHSYKLPSGMAKSGFLLSPLIEGASDFEHLYEPDANALTSKRIVRIKLEDRDNHSAWATFEPRCKLTLFEFTPDSN